ncbi:DUF4230 domain-containing protein [Bifidobacterium gallicum]|uniref:DUF4230 domain-containing protein n=1 Tax=Bifidobacterium gallicum TaxID=78342 RepID=UPI002378C1AC|nr:DUF4230 domain-containing protein [Bifidobacterium gallicum]
MTLQQPYIISNTPNMEESGVLEENNNILNLIKVSDVDQFQRECIEISEKKAVEGGLLEETKTEAAKNIKDMFKAALGDSYTVKVDWADAKK